jgi:hypothetical protein
VGGMVLVRSFDRENKIMTLVVAATNRWYHS